MIWLGSVSDKNGKTKQLAAYALPLWNSIVDEGNRAKNNKQIIMETYRVNS
jgi:hypothetical protein